MLPRWTLKETSSTAVTRRAPTVKVFDTERTSIWVPRAALASRCRGGLAEPGTGPG